MILITSIGELLLYYSRFFSLFHFTVKEKKNSVAGLFLCAIFILQDCMSSGLEY